MSRIVVSFLATGSVRLNSGIISAILVAQVIGFFDKDGFSTSRPLAITVTSYIYTMISEIAFN
jgi:F0F1-type ATP synthase assembly protein I